MVAALFAATLLASAIPADIEEQLTKIENRIGSHIGLAAIDLQSAARITHRADDRFKMCSTFKLLAAAAVLKRIDEGKEQLDRFINYRQTDLLEYAPITRQHVGEGGMKLEALCAAAIEQSDNTAANLLLRVIGGPGGVTEFARSIGDSATRLDQFEPELNRSAPGDERDTTTAASMCKNLEKLLPGDVLSQKSREQLEGWMVRNETGTGMIRAAVPAGIQVGDKTGRSGDGTVNDVAIIRPPNRPPIFIAIYSRGTNLATDVRFSAIADAARIVLRGFGIE